MNAGDVGDAARSTLAVVLAGGRGSRLRALTANEAKPSMPFGGKFRVVDFPLSNCINSGIRKVAVVTQYRAHTLIRHIQRGWNFLRGELGEFVELWPAQQQTEAGSWYLGTADAVYQNLQVIRQHGPRYVLILAGDHVYRQDYSRLIHAHIESGAEVTVSCVEVPRQEATAFGCVDADDTGEIVGFVEKPSNPPAVPGREGVSYASMGIYVFDIDVLLETLERDAGDDGSSHDFGHDIVPSLVGRRKLYAHPYRKSCVLTHGATEPYWRDVGTLDAFWDANMELISVTPQLDLYDSRWPIWTYQEQRPCAKFVFDDEDRRGMAVDSLVSAGCVVSGSTIRRSILFTDTRLNSYSEVTGSLILPRCDIGRRARLHNVIVASDCKVPEGIVIGEDAEADRERFHRTPAGITLVTPAMLEKLR
ncbi:MAG: glucose-1-phosphate adenylyltransferase [Nannocystales bacterium]